MNSFLSVWLIASFFSTLAFAENNPRRIAPTRSPNNEAPLPEVPANAMPSASAVTTPAAATVQGFKRIVTDDNAWHAERTTYALGYEGTGTAISALGQNAISFGWWLDRYWGIDLLFGFTKAAGTASESTSTAANVLATSSVTTTTYSGSSSAMTFLLGAVLKRRIYQSDWFQLYVGGVAAIVPPSGATTNTGTRTVTTPNTAAPNDFTTADVALGTIAVDNSMQFVLGPKIGTEFYIKWFPHLAVGFATGVLTTINAYTTTTTNTSTRTVATVGGVEGVPSTDSTVATTATVKRGLQGTTFGIGGTAFQFTGIFTVRYVW